jgi:hypothetical protein
MDFPQEVQGFCIMVFPKILLENCFHFPHIEELAFKVAL